MKTYRTKHGDTPAERLANRSERQASGCLVWRGPKFPFGHGYMTAYNTRVKVHRLAWEIANGRPVPDGMCVCHHCDNPPCIEPSHLFIGTVADNNADKLRKGRNVSPVGEASGRAKLTAAHVAAIAQDPRAQKVIAAEYGIKQPQVSRIKLGQTWRQREAADAAHGLGG